MKRFVTPYVARLDALNRRERILVFAAVVVAIVALGHMAFISPVQTRQKFIEARLAQHHKETAAAQAQKAELTRQLLRDPDADTRARIDEIKQQISEIDTALKGLQKGLVTPERMATLLQQVLGAERHVQVVQVRTMPASLLIDKNEGGATRGDAKAAAGKGEGESKGIERHVFKHGVEVTLRGNYLDLLEYVERLEKLPWQVFWGRAVMTADYPRVDLTLTLYTLSLDKSWLVV